MIIDDGALWQAMEGFARDSEGVNVGSSGFREGFTSGALWYGQKMTNWLKEHGVPEEDEWVLDESQVLGGEHGPVC